MTLETLIVVRDQASALIRAEVRAGEQRKQLERAVWDSINKLGLSIDAVSDASGLTPAEIHAVALRPAPLDISA